MQLFFALVFLFLSYGVWHLIPDEPINQGLNHYDALRLRKDATQDEIKEAYKKFAKQYHPDKDKGGSEANRFNEIL